MSIRMLCLALIIVVPGGWKIVMLVAAVLIPFLAVLFANDQKLESIPVSGPPADTLMLTPGGTTIVMDADGTFRDEHPDQPTTGHSADQRGQQAQGDSTR